MSDFVHPTFFDADVLSTQPSPPIWPLPQFGQHGPVLVGVGTRQANVQIGYAPHVKRLTFLPVLAVGNGDITHATASGLAVDHRNGFMTYYTNLDHVFAKPRTIRARRKPERVKVGDVLGFIASATGKPLGFEIWRVIEDEQYGPISPGEHLRSWGVLPWNHLANNDYTTDEPLAA
jgi:hypothetical protein